MGLDSEMVSTATEAATATTAEAITTVGAAMAMVAGDTTVGITAATAAEVTTGAALPEAATLPVQPSAAATAAVALVAMAAVAGMVEAEVATAAAVAVGATAGANQAALVLPGRNLLFDDIGLINWTRPLSGEVFQSPGDFIDGGKETIGELAVFEVRGDQARQVFPPRLAKLAVQSCSTYNRQLLRFGREKDQEAGLLSLGFQFQFTKSAMRGSKGIADKMVAQVNDNPARGTFLRRLNRLVNAGVLHAVEEMSDSHGMLSTSRRLRRRRPSSRRRC